MGWSRKYAPALLFALAYATMVNTLYNVFKTCSRSPPGDFALEGDDMLWWQQGSEEKVGTGEGSHRGDQHEEPRSEKRSVEPLNLAYAISGAAIVLLALLGPTFSDAMAMTLSQATPWAFVYGVLEISLFTCALSYAFKRSWGFAAASFLFACFSAAMLIALLTVVQVGTW